MEGDRGIGGEEEMGREEKRVEERERGRGRERQKRGGRREAEGEGGRTVVPPRDGAPQQCCGYCGENRNRHLSKREASSFRGFEGNDGSLLWL